MHFIETSNRFKFGFTINGSLRFSPGRTSNGLRARGVASRINDTARPHKFNRISSVTDKKKGPVEAIWTSGRSD